MKRAIGEISEDELRALRGRVRVALRKQGGFPRAERQRELAERGRRAALPRSRTVLMRQALRSTDRDASEKRDACGRRKHYVHASSADRDGRV